MFFHRTYLLALMAVQISFTASGPVLVNTLAHQGSNLSIGLSMKSIDLITLRFGLPPQNSQLLERTLRQLSDPRHDQYRRYLSREEAELLLHPDPTAVQHIQRWISKNVTPATSRIRGPFLEVKITVHEAETLFSRKLYALIQKGRDTVQLSTESIPDNLRNYVNTIQAWICSSNPPFESTVEEANDSNVNAVDDSKEYTNIDNNSINLETCAENMTPTCLRNLYRVGNASADPTQKTLYAIVGFNNVSLRYTFSCSHILS